MTNLPELFKGLSLNVYYKVIIYIAGIIFILSLFLEVPEINISYVRKVTFWAIVISMGYWFLDDFIIAHINSYWHESMIYSWNRDPMKYYRAAYMLTIVRAIIHGAGWLIFS